MTILNYLTDNYKVNFIATVKQIDVEKGIIILDNTYFHPQGGHQVFDTGTISYDNFNFYVIKVKNDNGTVLHYIEPTENLQNLQIGKNVDCTINWERRYLLMKTHTSQHLFSALIKQFYNVESIDMNIDVENSWIKFNKEISLEQVIDIQSKVNDLIQSKIIVSRDESNGIYKVIIGDYDTRQCGCTHVRNLSEIKYFMINKFESEKIHFLVDNLALSRRETIQKNVLEMESEIKTDVCNLKEKYIKFTEELLTSKKTIKNIALDLFSYESRYKNKTYKSSFPILNIIKRTELEKKDIDIYMKNNTLIDGNTYVIICKNNTLLAYSKNSLITAKSITDILKLFDSDFKGGGNDLFSQGGPWTHDIQITYNIIESALLEVSAYCD